MQVTKQKTPEMNIWSAWPVALMILVLFAMTEALPLFFVPQSSPAADWASLLYVSMRFIVLPSACSAHAVLVFFRVVKSPRPGSARDLGSVIVSVGYLVLLYVHPLPFLVQK